MMKLLRIAEAAELLRVSWSELYQLAESRRIPHVRICGMNHVRTSFGYPQSNGKLERWHSSLKAECIRPKTPLSLEDGRKLVEQFVQRYNTVRLHSAIGYVTPQDKLLGREKLIFAERDRKLQEAREQRKRNRQTAIAQKELVSVQSP
jgi:putative transposase